MPCRDDRDTCGPSNERYERVESELSLARQIISDRDAMLCALLNELKYRGIAFDVVSKASSGGDINIYQFWEEHSADDQVRISRILHQTFSEQEMNIVKKSLEVITPRIVVNLKE